MSTLWNVLIIIALMMGVYGGVLLTDVVTSYLNAKKHGRTEEWKVDLFGLKKGNYYVK